jgi:hypothetical protein
MFNHLIIKTMKKLAIIVTMMFLFAGFTMFSQDSPTKKLYEKYGGKDGYTTVTISQELFTMFAEIDTDDPDAQEAMDMMSELEGIQILMYEAEDADDPELIRFKGEIGDVKAEGYKELMVVKEKGEEVKFLAIKEKDKISELLLLISSEKEAGFVSIVGLIDMSSVAKLSKTMKLEGMENLEKLEEEEDE